MVRGVDGDYGIVSVSPAGMAVNTTKSIFSSIDNVRSYEVRKNGASVVSSTYTGPKSAVTVNRSNIGALIRPTVTYLTLEVDEVVVCQYSDGIVNIIEGYLAWKWDAIRGNTALVDALPVDHLYKSAAPIIPDSSTLMQLLSQPYQLEGTLRRPVDQPYHLTTPYLAKFEQLYSLQLLALLAQHYGDVPVRLAKLDQYWGAAALLRRLVDQPYHDARLLRSVIDQEWSTYGALLAAVEQRYAISQEQLLAMAEQQYDLSEYALLRSLLDQVYVMAPGDALVQRPAITVVTGDGVVLDPVHINIEHDEADYSVRAEIHLADEAQFLACRHMETTVTITIDATAWALLVEAPRLSRPEVGRENYIVPLVSPAVRLDAPYAQALTREFAGAMASAIVAEMAAVAGITVVWELIDWYIPAGTLYANSETPLAVIRKIVAAVGGIIQSSPAGDLICRPLYPHSTTAWSTAAPAHYITDQDNFFSVDSTPEIRDGYNRYLISDQDAATAGITLDEIAIDAQTKEIRAWQVPFDAAAVIPLLTSGGTWVTIAAEGIVTETLTELVEIVAGEGRTAKPIYALISRTYKQRPLGAITISEDGHLRTELADNSLVEIVYTTKYRKYIARSSQIEDVQFYPEEAIA